MIGTKVLNKVFGTANERVVKRLLPRVAEINALEAQTKALSDEQLRAKTVEFKARIAAALDGSTDEEARIAAEKQALDDLLPEAFAVVREAGWRAVNMRPYRCPRWCCTCRPPRLGPGRPPSDMSGRPVPVGSPLNYAQR